MSLTKVSYSMIQGAPVNVMDFGAVGNGSTNDRDAIQAALDHAVTLGNATVYFPPAVAYKLNSGITIDTSTTIVNFGGNKIDFSGMTTGNALTITRSENDGNLQNAFNHVHMISNGSLFGPGGNNTSVIAFSFNNAGGFISGGIVSYMAVINFGKDVYFGDGAFCIEFHHCNFTLTSGTPTTYSINAPSGVNNAGERLSFIGCMWNNRDFVLKHDNPNGNMFFVNCSLDYSSTRVVTLTNGAVYFTACHIEQNSDNDSWFVCDGGHNLKLSLHQCDIINQNLSKNYAYFYVNDNATSHGVIIKDCRITGTGVANKLIHGNGRTDVSGAKYDTVFGNAVISTHQNMLAYGNFESANYTADWTLSGGAIRSSAQSHGGTYSLSFPSSVGVSPNAIATVPCNSTQSLSGELWYKVTNITGTSGTFYITVNYLDKGGNILFGGAAATVTTNVSAWTYLRFTSQILTPPGTYFASLNIQIFGTASGTPVGYVDDVVFNVT